MVTRGAVFGRRMFAYAVVANRGLGVSAAKVRTDALDEKRPAKGDSAGERQADPEAKASVESGRGRVSELAHQATRPQRQADGGKHHGEDLDLGQPGVREGASAPGGSCTVGVALGRVDRGRDEVRCIDAQQHEQRAKRGDEGEDVGRGGGPHPGL
jgi:hypothetical protein